MCQDLRRGWAAFGCGAAHDRRNEVDLTTPTADARQRRRHFDDVARTNRRMERHIAVPGEQALVTVTADGKFSGDVTEQS
jgi:hypothetical protein